MEKSIHQLYTELIELEAKTLEAKQSLINRIVKIIEDICDNKPKENFKRLGKHMVSISSKDLLGGPWAMEYYDWTLCPPVIMDYLRTKDVKDWKELLQAKLDSKKNYAVEFKTKNGNTAKMDPKMIQLIIDKL